MVQLALIAAVARNGVIGRNGRLPWNIPADLQRFRTLTLGHPVLMGRRTWDSLPQRFRPLPGRRNIVVTRSAGWAATGAEAAPSLDAAIAAAASGAAAARAFVIGGGQLYAAAMPLADELLLTEVDVDVADGDTVFPVFNRDDWREVERAAHAAAADTPGFAFVTYLKR